MIKKNFDNYDLNRDNSFIIKFSCSFQPPNVTCNTRLWHPNINEDGEVCLSLLRQSSYDSLGNLGKVHNMIV